MATTSAAEGSSEYIETLQDKGTCTQLASIFQQDVHIIPEETLRKISQGSMKSFILESKEYTSIAYLWDALLKTFKTANIPSSHRVATCNAVCGFLEAAWASQDPSVRQYVLSGDVWLSTLRVYWARFEEGKLKPMRQILTTLTKILKDHPQRDVAEFISQEVVDEVTANLVLADNRSRLKACISSLEFFLRKGAISMTSFLSAVGNWLTKNYDRWAPVLKHDCSELSIPTTKFLNLTMQSGSSPGGIQSSIGQIFTIALLRHALNPDLTPTAGSLITTLHRLLKKLSETDPTHFHDSQDVCTFWVAPLKYIMLHNLSALEPISDHVLYPLFHTDHGAFRSFIKTLPIQVFLLSGNVPDVSSDEFTLLFSTLQVAKEIGLVHEDRLDNKCTDSTASVVLDSRRIGVFIGHQDSTIRISALSLLIMAPSTTKPPASGTLEALRDNLPFIHPDPDSRTRGEILGLVRKLVIRLRGGMSVSQKTIKRTDTIDRNAIVTVEDQHSFLQWYVGFLQSELRPTASYQRHISALKALDLLLRSGMDKRIQATNLSKLGQDQVPWVRSTEIFSPSLFKALVDLFIDPFDEVRETSLSILSLFPAEFIRSTQICTGNNSELSFSFQLSQALSRAEELASCTSRADHADTVARLLLLLFTVADNEEKTRIHKWYQNKSGIMETILSKLEQKLSGSKGLFSATMRDQPFHGYISALRYIVAVPNFYSLVSEPEDGAFQRWELFHKRILSLCERIWVEIKDVLCVDSPEGHTEDTSEDLIVGPKDILSYSWRALRESSLLLHSILSNPTYAPRLTRDDFAKIGTLSFTQLAELRHRGAFSAVSQTFTTCCQCCGKSKDTSVSSLLADWYQNALKIIDDQASQLTRRSAGLPALVSAIVSSNPGGPLFQQVMHELHGMSRQPAAFDKGDELMKLPQVHAMNCLKDIFTTTRLRQSTEAFIMPALVIAAECLDSTIWAIRNCGLMLFRELMRRMSRATPGLRGSHDGGGSEAGLRIQFKRYPGLSAVLKQLLQSGPSTTDSLGTTPGNSSKPAPKTEQVFPALELISEKVPSVEDDPVLRELALLQTRSRVWAIREQAARSFAFLLNREETVPIIQQLLNGQELDQDQNHLHGRLLCIRYSLQKFRSFYRGIPNDRFRNTAGICEEIFGRIFPKARSPFVQAAVIDILNDTVEDGIACGNDAHVTSFIDTLAWDYGLYNSLEKMATWGDSAHEIPSSTLLRRGLGLTTLISLLLGSSESDALFSLMDHISSVDLDGTHWILQQCHCCLGNERRFWLQMVKLYVNILTKAHAERVMSMATSNLADILESLLEQKRSTMSEPDIAIIRTKLASLPHSVSRMSNWGRDMVDSDLRLHGCILAIQSTSLDDWSAAPQVKESLESWRHKIRFAIRDETEFTTRYSAVISMKSFIQASHTPRPPVDAEPFLLGIYLILYDMLNDDDEELRDISTITASYVLQSSLDGAASALVPLATSSRLAQFLATNFQTSPIILQQAIQRLTGQQIKLSSHISNDPLISVSNVLDESMKSSTVLFVEEKQNLFIDDAREAELWSSVLRQLHLGPDKIDSTLSKEFPLWVSEGLLSLAKATELETVGGMLGFASKPEIFVTGVRVIYAAGALLSRDLSVSFDFDKKLMATRATHLLEVGRLAWIPDQWLSPLTAALCDINLE